MWQLLRSRQTALQSCRTILHPPSNTRELQFPHILLSTCCYLFLIQPSCRCEVLSPCSFHFRFPDDWWCLASFHVLIGYLNTRFEGMLFRSNEYILTDASLSPFPFLPPFFLSFFLSFHYLFSNLYLKMVKNLKSAYVPQQLGKTTCRMGTGPGFTRTEVFYKEVPSLSLPIK